MSNCMAEMTNDTALHHMKTNHSSWVGIYQGESQAFTSFYFGLKQSWKHIPLAFSSLVAESSTSETIFIFFLDLYTQLKEIYW